MANRIDPRGTFKVECSDSGPYIAYFFSIQQYIIVTENILYSVVSDDGNVENPARETVDSALAPIIASWGSLQKGVEGIANQRNLCLYGDPALKPCLLQTGGWNRADGNCAAMIMLGILILLGESKLESVQVISGLAAEKVGLHPKAEPYSRPVHESSVAKDESSS